MLKASHCSLPSIQNHADVSSKDTVRFDIRFSQDVLAVPLSVLHCHWNLQHTHAHESMSATIVWHGCLSSTRCYKQQLFFLECWAALGNKHHKDFSQDISSLMNEYAHFELGGHDYQRQTVTGAWDDCRSCPAFHWWFGLVSVGSRTEERYNHSVKRSNFVVPLANVLTSHSSRHGKA